MAGKGGGAWKVAYADFVTAMMAFFLVMWLVGQNKPMKEAVAGYFRDPFAIGQGMGGAASEGEVPPSTAPETSEARVSLPEAPRRQPRAITSNDPLADARRKTLMVKLHDGNQAAVGTAVQFDEDSAELDETGQTRLSELAPILRGKPNKIEIRGHSTNRPLDPGSRYRDAWELCYARCQTTLEFLVSKGVEPERIRLSQANSFEPHTRAAEPDSRLRNARVEVYLLGEFVEDLQGTKQERDAQSQSDH